MRKRLVAGLATGIALLTLSGTALAQGSKRIAVAVMDFDYGTVNNWWGQYDIGKGMADQVVDELVNDGTFRVIERKKLDTVLAEQDFSQSIQSFRALSRTEASDIRPNRIDFYVVRAGDTWQSIAQRAGEGIIKASTLAIMNNHPVNDQPRPGERIKIVVAG